MTSRQAGGDPERNKPRAAAGFSRNFQPVATSKEGILSVRKKSPLPRSVQRERAAASGEGWRRHTYAHVHTHPRTPAQTHILQTHTHDHVVTQRGSSGKWVIGFLFFSSTLLSRNSDLRASEKRQKNPEKAPAALPLGKTRATFGSSFLCTC